MVMAFQRDLSIEGRNYTKLQTDKIKVVRFDLLLSDCTSLTLSQGNLFSFNSPNDNYDFKLYDSNR